MCVCVCSSCTVLRADALFPDQTPTPTRFLRIGEKIGLFQELEEAASNPFDQDFKSATSDLKSSSQESEDEEDESKLESEGND